MTGSHRGPAGQWPDAEQSIPDFAAAISLHELVDAIEKSWRFGTTVAAGCETPTWAEGSARPESDRQRSEAPASTRTALPVK